MNEVTAQVFTNTLLATAFYALIAIGLTLIFSVVKVVHFAYGQFFIVGGYFSFWLFELLKVDPFISIIPSLIFGGLLGALSYPLFKSSIPKGFWTQALLAIGVGIVLENGYFLAFGANYRTTPTDYSSVLLHLGPISVTIARLIQFVVAVFSVAAVIVFLERTTAGKALRATSQNVIAARIVGIRTHNMYRLSFIIATALGVMAGAVSTLTVSVYPYGGFDIATKALAMIVVGGMGSVSGAVVGAGIFGLAESVSGQLLPEGTEIGQALAFALLIAVLLIKPRGILGRE